MVCGSAAADCNSDCTGCSFVDHTADRLHHTAVAGCSIGHAVVLDRILLAAGTAVQAGTTELQAEKSSHAESDCCPSR